MAVLSFWSIYIKILMRTLIVSFLVVICNFPVLAQESGAEVVATCGGYFQASNIQIDWTLGELLGTTIGNGSQQITQGFLQPIDKITSTQELRLLEGTLSVFPNPTSEILQLHLSFHESQNVTATLFDTQGRLLEQFLFEGIEINTHVSLQQFAVGTYFLKLTLNEGHATTFKVIKLNQ